MEDYFKNNILNRLLTMQYLANKLNTLPNHLSSILET